MSDEPKFSLIYMPSRETIFVASHVVEENILKRQQIALLSLFVF